MFSKVILVNNTSCDTSMFTTSIIDAIKNGRDLPEEIFDLFTLTIIEVEDGKRGILNAA